MSNFFLSLFAKASSIKNSRYVNRFVLIKQNYDNGNTELSPDGEKVFKTLQTCVEPLKKLIEKYPVIKEIQEVIYVHVKDVNDAKITVEFNHGEITVSSGWDASKKPTMLLPLFSANIKHLYEIISDGEISTDDVYRFIRVLFIPFLKALYQADYSNLPKDKSYLQLDNFLHVEVLNETGREVEGFPGPAQATVVNVDGQWLVFEGFQGDPDVKYSMNVQQSLQFAYLLRIKFLQHAATTDFMKLMPYVNQYNELKKEVQVYERSWHTVEELDK